MSYPVSGYRFRGAVTRFETRTPKGSLTCSCFVQAFVFLQFFKISWNIFDIVRCCLANVVSLNGAADVAAVLAAANRDSCDCNTGIVEQ